MKKKVRKTLNFAIKDLYSKNTPEPKSIVKEANTETISAYSMTGSGFNGKEISWNNKKN